MTSLKKSVVFHPLVPEVGNWTQIRKLVDAEQVATVSQVPKRLWVRA